MGIVDPEFVYVGLVAASPAEIFERMGSDLTAAGRAKDTFVEALNRREGVYPTGLPVPGGVAIPHADPEHVNHDTIAIATLASPVEFGAMAGDEDELVSVSAVFLLALADPDAQIELLPEMIKNIQNADFIASLKRATDPSQIAELANRAFST